MHKLFIKLLMFEFMKILQSRDKTASQICEHLHHQYNLNIVASVIKLFST
jgi:hypothetical protein